MEKVICPSSTSGTKSIILPFGSVNGAMKIVGMCLSLLNLICD